MTVWLGLERRKRFGHAKRPFAFVKGRGKGDRGCR